VRPDVVIADPSFVCGMKVLHTGNIPSSARKLQKTFVVGNLSAGYVYIALMQFF